MKLRRNVFQSGILAIIVIFTAALISGCKSYQFGNPTELPFDSIYIKPVTNDSFAPQAQASISSQIRDIFIHDGRTKLVTSSEAADAVLIVNLTEYRRRAAARRSVDTTVAAGFSLVLTAEVSLFNQNKGDYYFQERIVRKSSNAYLNAPYDTTATAQSQDFLQSEYQAMPRLTRDLARRIADEVLNPWEPR
jgi:hypothetical protein